MAIKASDQPAEVQIYKLEIGDFVKSQATRAKRKF